MLDVGADLGEGNVGKAVDREKKEKGKIET